MQLDEFIKDTLSQISKGILDAQKEGKSLGAIINPSYLDSYSSQHVSENGECRFYDFVDFEIGLTESDEKGRNSGIGVFLGKATLGISKSHEDATTSITRIKFRVPVCLPVEKNK